MKIFLYAQLDTISWGYSMIKTRKVMIIDDNVTNLNIARKALHDEYNIVCIKDPCTALAEIVNTNPDVILLDVEMPILDGFELIKLIKSDLTEPYRSIPIIFLTAKDDGSSEFQGLNLGAVDYVRKPFSAALLKKRVELHLKLHDYNTDLQRMVKEQVAHIEELQYAVVHSMSEMVERRDHTTGGHIVRTSRYLKALMQQLIKDSPYASELVGVDINMYASAAQMHDVGKISISDTILLKEGKLTDEEYELMKQHTTFGADIIMSSVKDVRNFVFLETAASFALYHHEKWNGKGYPKGLQGVDIPLCGRMMALADAYDAIISRRPYKVARHHSEAVEIIMKDSGEHFDPVIVNAFVTIADEFKKISQENIEEVLGD